MIKNNKLKTIISSLIILLPMAFGVVMWNKLPDTINMHWNTNGEADGTGSKALVVFLLPLIFLAFHWLALVITTFDRNQKNQNKKALSLVFWIIPFLSLYVNFIIYSFVFGIEFKIEMLTFILLGIMFVVFGNYMPKVKRNSTLGIKVKWALENDENWDATHRFGGRAWFFSGIVLMFMAFFATNATIITSLLVATLLVSAVAPTVYSYVYFLKQKKAGTATITPLSDNQKKMRAFSLIAVAIVLIALCFILFTGDMTIDYGEDSFTISATFCNNVIVNYDDIDSIEYRENNNGGMKVNGFNSARLLLGAFKNDEFGNYTRYSYTACNSAVVLKIDDKTLVLSGKTDAETKEIYNKLK